MKEAVGCMIRHWLGYGRSRMREGVVSVVAGRLLRLGRRGDFDGSFGGLFYGTCATSRGSASG